MLNDTAILADGLLSVGDACRFLRCSRSFLYALMGKGEIGFVSLSQTPGRSMRRIPRRALVEFAAGRLTVKGKERTGA